MAKPFRLLCVLKGTARQLRSDTVFFTKVKLFTCSPDNRLTQLLEFDYRHARHTISQRKLVLFFT
jgi:hypothetical protein